MAEVGRTERLRRGEAIELKPGLYGKLNAKERKLELSNGKKLSISPEDQKDLFPASEQELNLARKKEETYRGIKEHPLGEFGYQYSQKGIAGGVLGMVDKLVEKGEEYQTLRQAKKQVSEEISKKSPWTSGAATAASIGTDIALTGGLSGGMRAAASAPLLTAVEAGPRIFEEPKQVAGEVAASALGGALIDKGAKFLKNVSNRRGAAQALPKAQATVKTQNTMASAENQALNAQKMEKHAANIARTENENAARLHQHNLEIADKKNKFLQAESDFKTRKGASEQEAKRIKDEFDTAKRDYDQAINNLPEFQKKAQMEFSHKVTQNAQALKSHFPKDAKINSQELQVGKFIDEAINKSGYAGSKEGNQAAKILSSIFPEGETLAAKDLASRYIAIEGAIQRAEPDVQKILGQFKESLGSTIPSILENRVIQRQFMPVFKRNIESDLKSIFSELKDLEPSTRKSIQKELPLALRDIGDHNFLTRLNNGEIGQEIIDKVAKIDHFLPGFNPNDIIKMQKAVATQARNSHHVAYKNILDQAKENSKNFCNFCA